MYAVSRYKARHDEHEMENAPKQPFKRLSKTFKQYFFVDYLTFYDNVQAQQGQQAHPSPLCFVSFAHTHYYRLLSLVAAQRV
jgi:hypothetical protein